MDKLCHSGFDQWAYCTTYCTTYWHCTTSLNCNTSAVTLLLYHNSYGAFVCTRAGILQKNMPPCMGIVEYCGNTVAAILCGIHCAILWMYHIILYPYYGRLGPGAAKQCFLSPPTSSLSSAFKLLPVPATCVHPKMVFRSVRCSIPLYTTRRYLVPAPPLLYTVLINFISTVAN